MLAKHYLKLVRKFCYKPITFFYQCVTRATQEVEIVHGDVDLGKLSDAFHRIERVLEELPHCRVQAFSGLEHGEKS